MSATKTATPNDAILVHPWGEWVSCNALKLPTSTYTAPQLVEVLTGSWEVTALSHWIHLLDFLRMFDKPGCNVLVYAQSFAPIEQKNSMYRYL